MVEIHLLRCDFLKGYPSGRRSTVYHSPIPPLQLVPSFLVERGSNPSIVSTSAPASSALCLLSPFKLAPIAQTNLRIRDWSLAGYRRAETLSLTSLHVASGIHTFYLASCA